MKSFTSISMNYQIIKFNLPSTRTRTTNTAKRFLNLLNQHFPHSNKLQRMFKRNIVKAILHTVVCIM